MRPGTLRNVYHVPASRPLVSTASNRRFCAALTPIFVPAATKPTTARASPSRFSVVTASYSTTRHIPIKKQLTEDNVWKTPLRPDSKPTDIDLFQLGYPHYASSVDFLGAQLPGARKEWQRANDKRVLDNPSYYNVQPNTYVDPREREAKVPINVDVRTLLKFVVSVRNVVRVTKKGKLMSISSMVIVGNGKGVAGYGDGKAEEATTAVQKATSKAVRNMVGIERYDDRTLIHPVRTRMRQTSLELAPAPPGTGIRTNPFILEICRCCGIQDIRGKVRGSTNPINVVKATFEALLSQRTPEELARRRGMQVVDVRKVFYDGQVHSG